MGNTQQTPVILKPSTMKHFTPVNEFEFCGPLEEDTVNGSCFSGVYIPEEIVANILGYIPSNSVLELSLVCKKWCNIIKSEAFWIHRYNQRYPNKAKKLPWYVYYSYFTTNNFTNLIKNGNGEQQFSHWKILKNYGDKFRIEDPPVGAKPLPLDVPDFNGHTSCFATSFYECNKVQIIPLENKRLLRYIIKKHSPKLYASEWFAGRFDCGCRYNFGIFGYEVDRNKPGNLQFHSITPEGKVNEQGDHEIPALFFSLKDGRVEQWMGKNWEKLETTIGDYPKTVNLLVFSHEGQDTQFWKGHYGSKMAGAVVKFLFDSIQPIEDLEN